MDLIPITYKQEVICFNKQEKSKSQDEIDIVILIKSGKLMEIQNGAVAYSIDLLTEMENPKLITFFTYDENVKHYLVKTKNKLIILRSSSGMQIVKLVKDVTSLQIYDFYIMGQPQIVVQINDSKPEVVNLYGLLSKSELEGKKPTRISETKINTTSQVQNITLRLNEANRILREKKTLSAKILLDISSYLGKQEFSINEVNDLVPALGIPVSDEKLLKKHGKIHLLILNKQWHRFFSNNLLVGFHIRNLHDRSLEGVELMLRLTEKVKCTSLLVSFEKGEFEEYEYKLLNCLMPQTSGFIIGCVYEPYFVSQDLEFSGSLIYKLNGDEDIMQIQFDPIVVHVSDFFSSKLDPLEADRTEETLVGLISTADKAMLKVKYSKIHNSNVFHTLSMMGFIAYDQRPQYVIYPLSPPHPLGGLVLRIANEPGMSDDSQLIENIYIFARNKEQYILFVQILSCHLPDGFSVHSENILYNEMHMALEKLHQEVAYLSLQLCTSTPKPTVPLITQSQKCVIQKYKWVEMLIEFAQFEKNTDIKIHLLEN